MSPMQYMIQMRRANKSIPAILCIIIFILLFLPAPVLAAEESDSGSGSVDPYVMNTYAASHIQVANVSLDPSVLMPGDIATATIVMENTGKDLPVAISDALVVSKDLKVLTGIYEKVGTIGPGNRLSLTFTLQAGITPGIYYPVFTASFRGIVYNCTFPRATPRQYSQKPNAFFECCFGFEFENGLNVEINE